MRRFISITLGLALLLSLTACFGPPVDPDTVQERYHFPVDTIQ